MKEGSTPAEDKPAAPGATQQVAGTAKTDGNTIDVEARTKQ